VIYGVGGESMGVA
jgi:Mg/Co/Ni transporter MgtE